ncbi:MAG: hypothetical protein PHX08_09310, partial [Lachnospiraceae bacterium]|nr:hypothetical protein [Lachnospiraceae bacterium]
MIKFKLSQPIIWIYYFCTLFFCISGYTLAHYIYPNTRVIFLLQFVAVGLLLCLAIEQIKEITLNYNKILLVIMAFFVYFRSNDIKHGYLYSPFIMFSCFILCFFMPYVKNGLIVGVRFILIGYLIYIFSTIWLFFDHKTYLGYIVNLFPTTKKQLISWYESGCIAGLTSHYSTNALYIAIGVLILA